MANNAVLTLSKEIAENYTLCSYCISRQIGKKVPGKPESDCYICKGLMNRKDLILDKIRLTLNDNYEYDTFVVGATLPYQIYEREDQIRAHLKIRGRENIKYQLTKEIGSELETLFGKRVDYKMPDLTILVNISKDNDFMVSFTSRPVVVKGKYRKLTRGLPQKQGPCSICDGNGCGKCGMTALSGNDSVQGIISQFLIKKFGGRSPSFLWAGSEDKESLVQGNGRPFFARIFDPKIRSLGKPVKFKRNGIDVIIQQSRKLPLTVPFKSTTRTLIESDRRLKLEDLQKIKILEGEHIKFTNRSKMNKKKIYAIKFKRINDNSFYLTLLADGGLMIKQFVEGKEYTKPNISAILDSKCKCLQFDIVNVQLISFRR